MAAAPGAEQVGRIVGLLPGLDELHVFVEALEPGVEAALFSADSASALFSGAPVVEDVRSGLTTIRGLITGTTMSVGLGVRRAGDVDYVRSGAVLEARLAAPILVDPDSTAVNPDGATAATAFSDPVAAIFSTFPAPANLWMRAGTFDVSALPVLPGTGVYGGFDALFDPARRGESETILRANSNQPVVSVAPGIEAAILDGIAIDGQDLATVGVDVDKCPAQLRNVQVRDCSGRGIRLRNEGADKPVAITIAGSLSTSNGGDGLSANGPFELVVDSSVFSNNVQEGLDVDDLVAPDGETVSLTVMGSRFSTNGTQGLDIDLSEPVVLGTLGGRFEVEIEGSLFERNGEEGLLVDFDFELVPGWKAEVVLRGNTARANGGAGVRVDTDAPGSVTVHRLLSTSNIGDGLSITSETDPGLVFVSSSALTGNQGAGVRASLGNRSVALSHSILAGNAVGGLVSEVVESTASSSIAWLQPNPFQGTRSIASSVESDPSRAMFLSAPEFYGVAQTISAGSVFLGGSALPATDAVVELRDDGVARIAAGGTGDSVLLDPAPSAASAPTSIVAFAPGSVVDEDWTLLPNSPALASGLAGPAGPADSGVYGAASGGTPGFVDAVRTRLFALSETVPAVSSGLDSGQTLELFFRGGGLDPASVDSSSVRAFDVAGAELTVGLSTSSSGTLLVNPPAGGWGAGSARVELSTLRASDGTHLCASTVLTFSLL